MMLILKSLHIVFVVTWFAGLFYLPRLYVYHAMATDKISIDRFLIMERKLFWGIMTPSGILAILSGLWLWLGWGFYGGWLYTKVGFVVLLMGYHFWCYQLFRSFKSNDNRHSHVWYRWFNEIPVVLLFVIVFLVVLKPM